MDFGFRRNDLRAFDRIADRKQDAADILKTFENRLDQGKSKIWPEEKTFQLNRVKVKPKERVPDLEEIQNPSET